MKNFGWNYTNCSLSQWSRGLQPFIFLFTSQFWERFWSPYSFLVHFLTLFLLIGFSPRSPFVPFHSALILLHVLPGRFANSLCALQRNANPLQFACILSCMYVNSHWSCFAFHREHSLIYSCSFFFWTLCVRDIFKCFDFLSGVKVVHFQDFTALNGGWRSLVRTVPVSWKMHERFTTPWNFAPKSLKN